jgi:hypothetical protein
VHARSARRTADRVDARQRTVGRRVWEPR